MLKGRGEKGCERRVNMGIRGNGVVLCMLMEEWDYKKIL